MEERTNTQYNNEKARLFMVKSATLGSIVVGFMQLLLWLMGAKVTFILINGILIVAYIGYIIRGVNQLLQANVFDNI